jgi:hypothetical protein
LYECEESRLSLFRGEGWDEGDVWERVETESMLGIG